VTTIAGYDYYTSSIEGSRHQVQWGPGAIHFHASSSLPARSFAQNARGNAATTAAPPHLNGDFLVPCSS
jgi:hypothetical protein